MSNGGKLMIKTIIVTRYKWVFELNYPNSNPIKKQSISVITVDFNLTAARIELVKAITGRTMKGNLRSYYILQKKREIKLIKVSVIHL